MGGGELFKSRTCSSKAEFIFPVPCHILLTRTGDAARKVRIERRSRDGVPEQFKRKSDSTLDYVTLLSFNSTLVCKLCTCFFRAHLDPSFQDPVDAKIAKRLESLFIMRDPNEEV